MGKVDKILEGLVVVNEEELLDKDNKLFDYIMKIKPIKDGTYTDFILYLTKNNKTVTKLFHNLNGLRKTIQSFQNDKNKLDKFYSALENDY